MKKIIISIFIIIGIAIIIYIGFITYSLGFFPNGCGMDDGPFKAKKIEKIELSENILTFNLSDNGKLVIDNRIDSLSPILALLENGKIIWTLDTDVSKTAGYETCRIWEINNVTITKNTDPIKLTFTAHWTFGGEAGNMKIDRKTGDNSFCLSW